MSRTYRDWQAGDGIQCCEASKAPADLPCGRPVRTCLSVESVGPGRGNRTKTRPLCVNHSDWSPGAGQIMIQARRAASEKLISQHWDEYRMYLADFVRMATDEIGGPA